LLDGIEGVGLVAFGAQDVVRHELVGRIVDAYDRAAAKKAGDAKNGGDRK
jgi:phosphate starvation-inducible PhoH-like protein